MAALEAAKSESIAGISLFTELGVNAPDLPFFLPGLVKAGTIRLLVIAAEPASAREPRTVVVDNVTSMVTFFSSMIDGATRSVESAHTVHESGHSRVATRRCVQ